ncbi:MAG: LptA/OstA family protein, partial [Gemmataceae bacterium]
WLDPERDAPAAGAGGTGRKPRHLEANRNVKAKSREMNISENNRLVVWFQDEPPAKLPPAEEPAPAPAKAAGPKPAAAPAAPGTPILGTPNVPGEPARPFDLKARSVQARVIRGSAKNTVDELFCEGAVVVTQAAAKPGERGTEVKGDTLKMNAAADNCYVLDVVGDTAELHTQKISILGPQVVIDQARNMAWVVGDGAMTMESATNFQGDKLKDPVPLNVLWKDRMFFNGSSAEFWGDIQATQDKARLACQQMEVTFDRVVQLRPGGKGEQTPRVRYMVCSKDVEVAERVLKGAEFAKYQHLTGTGLTMQAIEPDDGVKVPGGKTTAGNRVTTTGPGTFRVVEPGSATTFDPIGAAPKAAAKAAPSGKPDGLKMTFVAFHHLMDANSNTGVASFYHNVRVLHLPVKSADAKVDLTAVLATELPEGGLYLRSDRLRVMDKATDGKPNKRMVAEGAVRVQGRDFDASADVVMYDEAKDQIVFEGKDGTATLRKFDTPNGKPSVVSAKSIEYNRKTKQIKTGGTGTIYGETTGK